jgi:predicted ribosome quality control (RQC) complex YloA/Tae2 family protein
MERLERIRAEFESVRGEADADRLEEAMRGERIPVGLVRPGRDTGASGRTTRVSVEGVRIYTSTDGHTILVGRTGRANDRLTFKIASSEDLWLHVLGRPGAHVVIRNPRRRSRVPEACLQEAAGLAAWYSGARGDDVVDVQWTRRKNVRRLRGAPPGTVQVKRFQTVRVRPSRPEEGLS